MNTFQVKAREVPVVRSADVVVVGGGPGGICAALASARSGANTLLIERYGFLGGMATAGLMTSLNGFRNERKPNHIQTVRGIGQELVDRLRERGGACGCTAHGNFGELKPGEAPYAVSIDPEIFKLVALEMLEEAGVKIMLHSLFSDAVAEGRKVQAALFEGKSGTQAVEGRIYIDATGDGDLAARAGARFEKVNKTGERMMAMTLMYRMAHVPPPEPDEARLWINGLTTFWGPSLGDLDGSDTDDLTKAEIEVRKKLPEHIAKRREQYPDARLVDSAVIIGVRETRRIIGLYTITEEDCLVGRPMEDSVAVSANPVPNYYGKRRFLEHLGFEIPYRSLVPADLDNVLLAGRCISACQPAFQSARSMAPVMPISQASGTAAAMCVKRGCDTAELDVSALQDKLARDGSLVRIPPEER